MDKLMKYDYTKTDDRELMDQCAAAINELRSRDLFTVLITPEYFSDLDRIFNQTRNPDLQILLVPVGDFCLAQNPKKQLCLVPLPTLDLELEIAEESEDEAYNGQDTIH